MIWGSPASSSPFPSSRSTGSAPPTSSPASSAHGQAAELVVAALHRVGPGVRRAAVLAALRELGPFDAYGDPLDPPVWLWRAGPGWGLHPERPL